MTSKQGAWAQELSNTSRQRARGAVMSLRLAGMIMIFLNETGKGDRMVHRVLSSRRRAMPGEGGGTARPASGRCFSQVQQFYAELMLH